MTDRQWEERIQEWENHKIKRMKQFGFGPEIMKSKKVCPVCKSLMDARRDNCTKCGAKLPYTTVYQMYINMHNYCTICDTVVSKNAHYCPQCRSILHSEAVGQ